LKISALEQIGFLRSLVTGDLGLSERTTSLLKEVMETQGLGSCRIWAKTGWAMGIKSPVGWYVGYAVDGSKQWLFAMNMGLSTMERAHLRREMVLKALTAKKLCTAP